MTPTAYSPTMMPRALPLALLLLAATAGPAAAVDQEVAVGGNAFTPATVTVAPGEKVTWRFTGDDLGNHSVTADDGSFDSDPGTSSPQHPVGFEFTRTFPTARSFTYHCKVHSFMTGKVVVGTPDTKAPAFSGLKATQTTKTATIKFKLNEAADLAGKLKLTKSKGKGGKTSLGVKANGRRGGNTLKVPLKGLRPGNYKLTLRATDAAGNRSGAATVTLKVLG